MTWTFLTSDGNVKKSGLFNGELQKDVVKFTTSGSFVKANYPNASFIKVRVQAAGGGSGGCAATGVGENAASGGGGGGEYAEKIIKVNSLSASESVTVGTGIGTGGAAGNFAGTDGGDSSFGSFFAASGGSFSTGSGATSGTTQTSAGGQGGFGGTGSADLRVRGSDGGNGIVITGTRTRANDGGESFLGGSQSPENVGGALDGQPQGGGAPGVNTSGSSAARIGRDGGDGVVLVEVYSLTGSSTAGSSGSLTDLSDVTLTTETAGDGLVFNGTNFVNIPRIPEFTTAAIPAVSSYKDGQLIRITDWGVSGVLLRNIGGSAWERQTAQTATIGYSGGSFDTYPRTDVPYITFGTGNITVGTGASVDVAELYANINGWLIPFSGGNLALTNGNGNYYVFLQLTFTGNVATGTQLVYNQTGADIADSVYVGRAVVSGGVTSAVAQPLRGIMSPGKLIAAAGPTGAQSTKTSGAPGWTGAFLSVNLEINPQIDYEVRATIGSLGVSAGKLTQTYLDINKDGTPIIRNQWNVDAIGRVRDTTLATNFSWTPALSTFTFEGYQLGSPSTDFRMNYGNGTSRLEISVKDRA